MVKRPRIAVILDENTSTGGNRYEASKGYFSAVAAAGGIPFGIPYLATIVDDVISEFDGLLCCGGRFAFPAEWYEDPGGSLAPASDRLDIELALVAGYLRTRKPILGICSGMQLLAGMNGCRLCADVRQQYPTGLEHDADGAEHEVSIPDGSLLAALTRSHVLAVNSNHREAVIGTTDNTIVSARSTDGVIEAVEIQTHPFAVGVQWHQERFANSDHPGNAIFKGLIDACR